jgi:hypothetical protein
MSYSLKNFIKRFKNKGKEGILFLLLSVGVFVACQGALEDGTPFGPSTSTFKILPTTSIVTSGTDLTFTPFGGTAPYSWSSSNTAIGTIIVNTGVFTAGTTQGTTTVTSVDAVGNTATASVTIPGLSLIFDVTGATQAVVNTDDIITVLTNGSGAGFTATIANNNTGSTFLLLPTVVSTGTTLTFTSPATLPTLAQGNQTFTVTVTDTGNTNTGTLTYVFQADTV